MMLGLWCFAHAMLFLISHLQTQFTSCETYSGNHTVSSVRYKQQNPILWLKTISAYMHFIEQNTGQSSASNKETNMISAEIMFNNACSVNTQTTSTA